MNGLFVLLGIESWKPVIAALLLPPVPLLLMALLGARMILWRRGLGWLVLILSVAGVWLSSCVAVGEALQRSLSKPPLTLGPDEIAELKREATSGHVAIVVLGGGRELMAPEYGLANLAPSSLARLRYGVWLSRATGAPLAFSGGAGHAGQPGTPEADIASRIAAQEFSRPLKWAEGESRDTRENAARTVALLRPAGVQQIVLVTHGYHIRRALRDFEEAARRDGGTIRIVPAPMGLASQEQRPALRWMPSAPGFTLTRDVLHDWIGLMMGA